jgi:hypothetical protein
MEDVNKITASENPFKIVLGNKCDLEIKKEVFQTDITFFQEQTGIDIHEISAKESIKINEIFELITKKLITRVQTKNPVLEPSNNVYSLYNEDGVSPNKSQNCC